MIISNKDDETRDRTRDFEEFHEVRRQFPGIVVHITEGFYIDHAYIDQYSAPFSEAELKTAQKLLLEHTSWTIREIAWTVRNHEIIANAVFLIRARRPC